MKSLSSGSSLFDVLGRTPYSAAVIGKWHLAGSDQGFDHPRQLAVKHYFAPECSVLRLAGDPSP